MFIKETPKINAHLGKSLMQSGFQSFALLFQFNFFTKNFPLILKKVFPSNVPFFFRFLDLISIGMHYYGSLNLPPGF